jgi:single-strand DNA-binding protein
MVNKVILIGNLGKDPEMSRLESGAIVGRFSVATTESYKDKDGNWQNTTEWHDVIVWNEKAEHAEKYFKKGSTVYVEGKLTHRKYMDKLNVERYVTEITALSCRSLREPGQGSGYGKSSLPTEEPAHLPAQVRHETPPPTMSVITDAPVKNLELPKAAPIHLATNGRNTATVAAEHEPEPVGATEGGDNLPF